MYISSSRCRTRLTAASVTIMASIAPARAMSDSGSAGLPLSFDAMMTAAVLAALLASIVLGVYAAYRRLKQTQFRKIRFGSAALNNMPHGVVMVDSRQRVVFCNDQYLAIYGLMRPDVPPRMPLSDLLALRKTRGTFDGDPSRHLQPADADDYIRDMADGRAIKVSRRWLAGGGFVSVHEDFTGHRVLSRELAQAKTFLEQILDHIPTSIMVKRVADRKYLLVNRHAEKLMGRSRQQVIGQKIEAFHTQERATFINHRDDVAIRRKGEVLGEEYPVSADNGMRLYSARRVAVADERGEPQFIIQTNEDITDRRQTEMGLAHMAYHDALTGLPNRAAFMQALSQMIEACAGRENFAVMSLDLDRFREVNDVFGHALADKLLIEAVRRIQLAAQGAVIARLDGDEFGLIVDGAQPEAAGILAERLVQSMRNEFVINGKIIRIGMAAGISVFPHNGEDPASLLTNADAALFRAKSGARGAICIFEKDMDQQVRDRRAMHHDLSQAIKNGELVLNYHRRPTPISRSSASRRWCAGAIRRED